MSDSIKINITEGSTDSVDIDVTQDVTSNSIEISETPVPIDPVDSLVDLDTSVTGAELDALKTKSDGIEDGATADQSDAEIKTAYENNADTNAFTDADHTKLDGIEAGADVTDTTNVTAAGALMDSEVTNLDQVKAFDSSDYAAALGADDNYVTDAEKIIIGNTSGTNTGDQDLSSYQLEPSEGAFIDGDKTKLDGIESGATVDQSADEIKSLVDSATDSNVFTDADHTKLDGIEAGADVTDTDNVVSSLTAGSNITIDGDGTISSTDTNDNTQLSDEEVQDIVGGMVTGNSESGITVTYQDADGTLDFSVTSQTDENFTTADHTKLDGIEDGADVTPAWVPSSDPSYATETYVDTEVSNLVDSAPGTLDTLNELASALGDDANFSTTVTNNIATKLPLAGGTMTGNITMSGSETVDGRDLSVDGAKLDGIETGATADQTGAEIKSLYEGEADTNAFTDADHTKLDGIEAGADVTDTTNVSAAGALMDSEVTNLADVKSFDPADYAAALGADDNYVTDAEKIIIGNTSGTNTGDQDLSSYQLEPSEGAFVDGDKTKLDGIEASADVTDTTNVVAALSAGTNITIAGDGTISSTNTGLSDEEVQDIVGGMVSGNTQSGITVTYQDVDGTLDFSVASQTDENFTTADHTKLDGIESGADVTDTDNVTAAGALMDSEVTNLDQVKSFDSSDYATSAQGTLADSATQPGDLGTAATLDVGTSANEIVQLDGSARLPAVDASQLTNLPSGATELSDLSDVNTSTATNRNVLIADGTDFESRTLVEADISDLGSYLTDITGESLASLSDVTTTGAQLDAIKTKVDGIEAGATADQTGDEIKTAYEGEADTNAFTDAEKTKLGNIEASADVTDTTNVVAALTAGTNVTIGGDGTISATDTNTQLSDEEVQDIVGGMVTTNTESGISVTYDDTDGTLDFTVASQTDENFTTADHTKLDGIETGATADQTADEIRTLVNSATDSNVFTDADHTKLDGISSGADVTPAWVPSSDPSYATETYVDTEVSNLVDSAPGTLDTLNELAAALGDDPNFATTVSTSIGTKLPLAGGTMTGNIVMSGSETVDGRDISVDGTKLDGIESGATADQTGAEIKVAYEAEADTNAFTDADHTKLDGIETGADVTDTDNVVSALTAGTNVTIAGDGTISSTDTNTQLSDEEVQDIVGGMVAGNTESGITVTYDDTDGTLDFTVASQTDENFTTADHTKLDGVEAGATADQTGAEIKSLYEGEADTNAFTDAEKTLLSNQSGTNTGDQDLSSYQLQPSEGAFVDGDKTKLDGIESGADVTDTANVVSALTAGSNITIGGDGTISSTDTNTQLSDEEVQDIVGGMVTANTESGISVTYDDTDGTLDFSVASQTDENFTTADHTKLDGIESGADVTDTANVTAAGALMDSEVTNLDQVKAFDSSDYAPALGADDNYVTDAEKIVIGNTSGTNTGDQDLSSYQLQPSEGAFVNGDKTKLDGISSGADVTPAWVPSSDPSYATETYVDTEVSNLVNAAPAALDTLNELAAAIGDDANFSTTVTNSIATKLPLAGGTMTGNIVMTGSETVDGRDLSVDGAKLDGIEAGADVTDATNVTAAGALMDSEVTNLADVKAFDPADYAPALGADDNYVTDAEKIVIGNTSGTNTGDQDLSSYQLEPTEGAFVDGDKTKLDGIESGADVTDTANVTAAGALMDSEVTNLADVKAFDPTDYASALGADDNYVTDAEKIIIGNTSGTNTGDQDLSSYQLQPSEGAFVDGDKTKLDGIESGATADQTGAEIKTAYEGETDTNAFTDSEKSKLENIEASADVTDTTNVVAALTAGTNIAIAGDGTISSTDTNTQLSDEEVQDVVGGMVTTNSESGISVTYDDTGGKLDFSVTSQTDENFTTADHAKLDGIEANATADQTASEIRSLVDSATDSNVFTDADHTKLDGISSGADVTPAWVPSSDPSYATETYVDTEVSNLVDAAPGTLDTLNELAAALGDDPNFSTTVTNNIASKLPLAGGTMTGNIVMSGSETVDGRDLSVDGAKLDGIESGATADQTASEIRSLVDSATDSNVFTDADHTKLDGIEASADVTDTDNVVSALTAGTNITIAGDGTISSTDTNTQLSDEEVQDIIGGMVTTNTESGISVTYDDTGGKLDFSVTSQTDENFTTADHAKLDGIEAGADVTDTANVTAAGALMDSEVTNLADVKAFDPADYAAALGADDNYVTDAEKVVIGNTSGTNTGDQDLSSYQLQPSEGAFANGDKTKLDGIESGATADQTAAEIRNLVDSAIDSNVFTDANSTKLFNIENFATGDQTGAEIKSLYEAEADTNAFTDADHTKLDGIEASADVTDTTNVVAALTAGTNIAIAGDGTISATAQAEHADLDYAKRSSTSTQSINGTPAAIPWQTEVKTGTHITWSSGNNTRFTIGENGTYYVGGSISVYSASTERCMHIVQIRVNGSVVGYPRGTSYIRNTWTAWDWWTIEVANTPIDLVSGDYVEFFVATVNADTETPSNNGTTSLNGDASEAWVVRANGTKGDTGGSRISREYQVFDASLATDEKELLFVATKPGTIHWVGAVVDDPGTEDVQLSILNDGAGLSGGSITLSNASGYADYGYGVTEYSSSFVAGDVIEVKIDDPGEGSGSGAVAAQGPLYIEVVLSYDD